MLAFCTLPGITLEAQCHPQIQNMGITQSTAPVPINNTQCRYTFNFSFDIITNSGFKYLFFHSWLANDYPSPSIFNVNNSSAQNPGTSLQLGTAVDDIGKSFLDMGFINLNVGALAANTATDVTSKFAETFTHDVSVILTKPANSPGLQAFITRKGNSDTLHFDITGIKVIINQACGVPILGKTDVWGSNANPPDPKAQCYISELTHSFNDPQIALLKSCSTSPFKYAVGISTLYPTPIHITYKIYLHDPALGDLPSQFDHLAFTSAPIAISSGNQFSSGLVSLPNPYGLDPYDQYGIYVRVTAQEFSNFFQSQILEQPCAALPVKLKSFTVERKEANVLLKWTTAIEDNNHGFEIQRKSGYNDWQTVAFINTKAINGNSSTPVNYDFTEQNRIKGISQYRLKEIDINRKYSFSPVRLVRGENQKNNTIVFPNPSSDGKMNIIFESENVKRDITLFDINGRTVKQWKGVTDNNIQIENLNAGFYSIRILNKETGEQAVEKVLVKKR